MFKIISLFLPLAFDTEPMMGECVMIGSNL